MHEVTNFSSMWYVVTLHRTKPPAFFSNSSPSSPVNQRYHLTTNSPSSNYWLLTYLLMYLPMPAPSGAIHRLPTIVTFNFFNLNVLESLVIIPDVPLSHTYTPLLAWNPFMSLFTVWRIIFSETVLLTLTLLSAKYGTTLYLISTSSIENMYTNGLNIFCCNFSSSGCSVFPIVIISHYWNIDVSDIHSYEYAKR
jgi:hypothetical protein